MSDYGITFAPTFDRPPETMVGETVYDSDGNAIGWITNAPAEPDGGECYLMYNGKKYPAVLDFGFLGLMPITIDVGGFRYLVEVPNEE